MTIEEFFQACQRHDWTYEYSDDHSVWERGRRSKAALESGASEDPVKATILHDFRAHVFSGESFGKPKAAKPNILDYVSPEVRKVYRDLLDLPPVARAVVVDALRVRAMDFVQERLDGADVLNDEAVRPDPDLVADVVRCFLPYRSEAPVFDPESYWTEEV